MRKKHWYIMIVMAIVGCFLLLSIRPSAERYTYDAQGRVKKVIYEDGSYEEYQYDANGNIKAIKYYEKDIHKDTSESPGDGSEAEGTEGQGGGSTAEPAKEQEGASTTQHTDGAGQADSSNAENTAAQAGNGEETPVAADANASESVIEQAVKWVDRLWNDTSQLTLGKVYKKGVFKYKVTSIEKRSVQVVGVVKGKTNKKKYTIPAKVRFKGCTLKVTSIGSKVFVKCKKCKKVVLKSKQIKKIHKNAFAGLKKKTVIQVPRSCYKKYMKYIRKTKNYKRLKVKKSLL